MLALLLAVAALALCGDGGSVTPSGPPYSFAYSSFASSDPFVLSQASFQPGVIQLSDGAPFGVSSARFSEPMLIGGFETTFTIRMSNVAVGAGLEGMALVIVNGPQAFGETGGGLGYADSSPLGSGGLPNSLALEIDTFWNPEMDDPIYEHFSVHSLGPLPNSAAENSTARLCGPFVNIPPIATTAAAPYTITVRYLPPYAWADAGSPAALQVFVSSVSEPVGSCSLPIINGLLDALATNSASLMFTASGGATESDVQDLLSWSFQYLGVVSPNSSVAAGPTTAVAGSAITFTVQAHDQFGAVYAVGGDELTAVLPSGANVAGLDTGNGSYEVTFVLTRAGEQNVHIRLNGIDVVDSPFAIAVSPAAVDPPSCHATAIGTGVAGGLLNFTVSMFDAYGNAVTQPGLGVSATFSPKALHTLRTSYLGTNKYAGSLGVTLAGSYQVSVTVAGGVVDGGAAQPVTIVAGPYSPTNTEFGGGGLDGGIAGATLVFAATLFDSYGNAVLVGVADVSAVMDPSKSPAVASFAVDNVGNGTYIIAYSATRAGTYTMDVFVGPANAAPTAIFSPVIVTTNVPEASNTRVLGVARGEFSAGQTPSFRIGLRDAFNNTLANSENAVVTTSLVSSTSAERFAMLPPQLLPPPFVQYNISYTLTIAQGYYLSVFVNGVPITAAPFDVLILPGPVAPALSLAISMSGGSLSSSVTGRRNRFMIELIDQYGNPSAGPTNASVVAYLTGAQRFSVTVVPVSPSAYECSYTIDKIGAYSLWVTVDGVNIQGSPFSVRIEWAYTMTVVLISLVGLAVIILFVFAICVARHKRKRRRYLRI